MLGVRSDPIRDRAKSFLSSTPLTRCQQYRHIAPFHPGLPVRLRYIPYLLNDSVQQSPSQLGMGYLAAAKRNRELNTLTLSYKASDVRNFELNVMLARQRTHLDFFDCAGRCAALGVVGLLLLRVAILVVIGNAADRRIGGGSHF